MGNLLQYYVEAIIDTFDYRGFAEAFLPDWAQGWLAPLWGLDAGPRLVAILEFLARVYSKSFLLAAAPTSKCDHQEGQIVFVLDESESITPAAFDQVREFVSGLISAVDESPYTSWGIVGFGDSAYEHQALTTSRNEAVEALYSFT